ncbi:hypothetical protein HPHPP62_0772 [Helicobacter pylori Hp P-62]|nr:hypothetical protein HPHPP62_0772 [Helicobacter pylori Hp P-62]
MFVFIINSSKKINDKDNPKSYCHLLLFLSQKSILVMKTTLFKLLNQTIIPRYAAKLQYKIPK